MLNVVMTSRIHKLLIISGVMVLYGFPSYPGLTQIQMLAILEFNKGFRLSNLIMTDRLSICSEIYIKLYIFMIGRQQIYSCQKP